MTTAWRDALRAARRSVGASQRDLAARSGVSVDTLRSYESGKRHPSDKIVTRLAEVLGLDRRELFFLANPRAQALLNPEPEVKSSSTWEEFKKNDQLRRIHNITSEEMEMLSQVALLGDIRAQRDFIYILHTVRHALGR